MKHKINTIVSCDMACPFCKKNIRVVVKDEILVPSEPAEKRRIVVLEKNEQKSLRDV